ncbi:hypothetical protein Patl1_14005 [Pistacia atlantica]|uniref:Uncharacterized protein n=1 Tax=Pistacia atlantica TaxID=434234 RepID=A0ACC1AW35_9ROSI|nr:hypothetical protein Patl1_14005 [Pistacia atlantica]
MDDERLVYSVDEAFTYVGFGKYQVVVLLYAGLGYLAEAMEIMILSFIGPAIKKGFLGVALVASVTGLTSAFSPNYITLVTLRGLVGFGLGGGSVFVSWFLEFVPASNRGMWMIVMELSWTLGTIFEASLAWIVMPRLNWRWLLALSSLPSFAVLLLHGLVPESPRYLCMAGQTADAHRVLENIALKNAKKLPSGMLLPDNISRLDNEFSVPEHNPLLSSSANKTTQFKSGFSPIYSLFSSRLIRTTFLLWVLFFAETFLYYGVILLTSELSVERSECGLALSLQKARDASLYIEVFITSLAELPGLLISAVILDRVGRKMSMTILSVLTFIFLIPLAIRQEVTLTTGLLFGARMFVNGSSTVACIYALEVYPTSVRATGSGIANGVGIVGGMICPLVAVALVTGCHQTAAVILLEILTVLSIVCVLLLPFETRGRELADSL